jgi:hypothetical protein
MSLPIPPSINKGQIALDPINGIVYYKDDNGNLVSTTWSWLRDDMSAVSTDDDVTITGNLTVSGTTVSVNVETVTIADNILILNSNVTGSPTENAGIEIERGTSTNVSIRWNESTDTWQYTNNGADFYNISSIIENSVTLGTHTVGEYVENITSGTGVTISDGTGEGSNPTISIGQAVGTSDTVTFNVVNANVTGDVTGNVTGDVTGTVSNISNHGISDLSDVVVNDAANGDFLRYNGSNWINDPVNLTTDTVGEYVAKLAAGTGITITNNSGEGATPNIAFSGSIDNLSDVAITSAADGQILEFNGTNWVNSVRPSNEPMGHEDKSESTISFNEGTRTFSIAPVSTSFTVWCAGKRFVKTGTETVEIPDTSGLYYIYFNTSGVLSYRTSFFVWDEDAPTAYIYWNEVDNKAYFFADERHGITLDWATHEYLHRTRGAAIANGFGANNYIINGDGSLDSHAKLDIANGTFFDEDLQVDISHSATPTPNTWEQVLQGNAEIPVFYRLNNHWTKDVATEFPLKQGTSRPQYNLNTAGTWSATDIANNRFGVSWIIATNNLNEPIIAVLGQGSYTDNGSAEAEFYGSLNLDGFPIVEFRPLYKIIYECKDSYSNTPSASFTSIVDLRSVIAADQGIGTTAVSDHGAMTGLQDDDHAQYLNIVRHDALDHSTALGTASLNDLGDVNISSAVEGQGLVWSGEHWFNAPIPLSLDGLSDVIITSATPNQVLKWNGTNWVNDESPSDISGTIYSELIGDGSATEYVITHDLSTRKVVVSITEENAPYGYVSSHWEATDLNSIKLFFAAPVESNSIRVNVYAAVSGLAVNYGTTYTATVGDGLTQEFTIEHNLDTRDVFVSFRNADSPYQQYNVAWEALNTTSIKAYFDEAPAENSVKVLVYSSLSGDSISLSLNNLEDVLAATPNFGEMIVWNGLSWVSSSNIQSLTVEGDLTVNGTTTTINSTTISVDDKNIELGSTTSPTDLTADGGGITLKGDTDKTFLWSNSATPSWSSSENINLSSGKVITIDGTEVLSSTSLGSGITNSNLTSLGLIEELQASSPTFTGPTEISGTLSFQQTTEKVNTSSISSNVMTCDYTTGAIYYQSASPSANFTVNFTNVPTTDNKAITFTIFVTQGATGYIPNVLQIDGTPQTIKWAQSATPTPNANKIDIFSFTLIRLSSSWTVFGNANTNF